MFWLKKSGSIYLFSLPDTENARELCIARLSDRLEDEAGIERVHIHSDQKTEPDQLCIHYNPDRITLPRIRTLSSRLGAEFAERIRQVNWQIKDISHPRRARIVEQLIRDISGVLSVDCSSSGKIQIVFDRSIINEHELSERIKAENLFLSSENEATPEKQAHHHGPEQGRLELILAILAGLFTAVGWSLETFTSTAPQLIIAIYSAGYICGGIFAAREAWDSIRGGQFDIDFLMLFAAIGAAALGNWFEGALLLFLFSLGHALEHFALGRAHKAIEALSELAPDTAIVLRAGDEAELPVEELVVGDRVIIRTNEKIPADGVVVKGTSTVNQAPITGESIPVDKSPVPARYSGYSDWDRIPDDHRVFTGTINGGGVLEIDVAKISSQSTLARVVQLVTEADAQKSDTQRFTERFERVFVPVVLGIVFILLFAWVIIDEPFADSFYRAMAVLVAASPCALAIATPSAVLSGIARAGKGGVLFKGGAPLEQLGTIGAIAFDKTGTLTEGRPEVTDVVLCDGISPDVFWRFLLAVESRSDHPLALAVVLHGQNHLEIDSLPEVSDLISLTGKGIRATIEQEQVYIGKKSMFDGESVTALPASLETKVLELEKAGQTTMILLRGEQFLGAVGLMDTPRHSAADALAQLREMGIERMVMISGDNQVVAESVARKVGLDEAYGNLMPEDKVNTIQQLRRQQPVAMVGDGVNDAPAMATATVGIAMGAAGSDVALETADIALMADNLKTLPFAVGLSKKTRTIIRQNVWISLGMVAVLIPATLFGLGLGPAVALHEGSTLVVVLNALRLLGYKRDT